jgi:hypothetical protein
MSRPSLPLGLRPDRYFWLLRARTHLLGRINGTARRQMVEEMLADGSVAGIPAERAASSLPMSDRNALMRIHPGLSGAEYLPELRADGVEIARLDLRSGAWHHDEGQRSHQTVGRHDVESTVLPAQTRALRAGKIF